MAAHFGVTYASLPVKFRLINISIPRQLFMFQICWQQVFPRQDPSIAIWSRGCIKTNFTNIFRFTGPDWLLYTGSVIHVCSRQAKQGFFNWKLKTPPRQFFLFTLSSWESFARCLFVKNQQQAVNKLPTVEKRNRIWTESTLDIDLVMFICAISWSGERLLQNAGLRVPHSHLKINGGSVYKQQGKLIETGDFADFVLCKTCSLGLLRDLLSLHLPVRWIYIFEKITLMHHLELHNLFYIKKRQRKLLSASRKRL